MGPAIRLWRVGRDVQAGFGRADADRAAPDLDAVPEHDHPLVRARHYERQRPGRRALWGRAASSGSGLLEGSDNPRLKGTQPAGSMLPHPSHVP